MCSLQNSRRGFFDHDETCEGLNAKNTLHELGQADDRISLCKASARTGQEKDVEMDEIGKWTLHSISVGVSAPFRSLHLD